jgi:hypothetical protein
MTFLNRCQCFANSGRQGFEFPVRYEGVDARHRAFSTILILDQIGLKETHRPLDIAHAE